jgi:hypothetical protein
LRGLAVFPLQSLARGDALRASPEITTQSIHAIFGLWFFASQKPSSLLRFAHKTSKNRLQGDFLPCKLPKHAQ